ncbi:MAG: hypothetical protein SFY56_14915 [Bacteroidota bacterium]|nr:hypothetical protein [Bacteroidota bacterium]
METLIKQEKKTNYDLHSYFLQQGLSISVLNELLDSNTHMVNINKRFSTIFEMVLYGLVVATFAFAIYLPNEIITNFPLGKSFGFDIGFKNEALAQTLFFVKVAFVILAFPILAFALVLRRSRKKSAIIYQAYIETERMHTAFYKAIDEFKLQKLETSSYE